ncbi:alpha/beta fold hydrolase [Streptomyces sp. P1-3]|uniref:S9 family peptidase n=1 Tax=Streptomyces sp. P1-3 TaxID=3421658 RepID=UPI003D35F0B3
MNPQTYPTPLRRFSFRFDVPGRYAAGLAAGHDGTLCVESWSFGPAGCRSRLLPTVSTETLLTQPVPTGDGRVVVLRNGSPAHELALIEPTDQGALEHRITRLGHPAARLLPSPDPATLALLIITDTGSRSTVWRLTASERRLEPVLEQPGTLGGGLWLDDEGRRLALTHVRGDRPAAAMADLARGTVTPLWPTGGRPLLVGRRSRRILVADQTAAGVRLGVTDVYSSPPRFPAALNAIEGSVSPLAADPSGQRFALKVDRGARSHLAVFDTNSDIVVEHPLPAGVIAGTGAWTGTGLRFLFAAPHRPATVATLGESGACAWPAPSPGEETWTPAHLEWLDGPAGPIEAVVYGGPTWRDSPELVIALHGGPASAWRLDFSPLFQRLAAAGIAVVAPNQRGSTGYGPGHHDVLRGAWGVPDLEDVTHLARSLAEHRHRIGVAAPALYGTSYGAFLALLAAGVEPGLWSRCAVVAPFVSGPRLHRQASAPVRAMLERLGGLPTADDGLGPRDLLRFVGRIRAPLLILHGTRDDVIPVAHARALRRRLLDAGRCEGEEFRYLEVPGGRHGLLDEAGGAELTADLVRFLASRPHERRDRRVAVRPDGSQATKEGR